MKDPFPTDDEWDDSPYEGWGVDEEVESFTYRLSYWFWLHFYRLKRRLGIGI